MRFIALVIFGLMTAAPASAQYAALRPSSAVPLLDGCNGMSGYPDCHPDRIYMGRSVVISPNGRAPVSRGRHWSGRSAYAGGRSYPHYGYGYNCLHYGYPPNCAYYELPDWNGGMEIRNPGGG
jgi:hypothetical protein